MKGKLLVLFTLSTVAGAVLADHKQDILQTQFRQMAEECQLALDGKRGYDVPVEAPATLSGCYSHKVRITFQEAKNHRFLEGRFVGTYLELPRMAYGQDRPRLLRAALQAEQTLAVAAYDGALHGRLSPVLAYRVASATLPASQQAFASRAIARGADPSEVAEATAAGYQQ